MRIAVIGSGISGNLVARLLASEHEIVVFEAANYLGGHANTVDVEVGGRTFSVDTGFMVFNERTYPNLCRLLEFLGVPSRDSDMSFSVHCPPGGLEYQGSSLNGLFAQRRNALRPSFWRMLFDILRFNRAAARDAETANYTGATLGRYLEQKRFSDPFVDHYLLPMIAAIWSAPPEEVKRFPLHFLLGFLRNHGLIQIMGRPQWKTIVGGSRQYVEALMAPLKENVRLGCPVSRVHRHTDHVVVQPADQPAEVFDHVVLAAHADQALNLLADADDLERELLCCFPYQSNEAVLHTDVSTMPRSRRAWASWNYRIADQTDRPATVTYDLSRLQGHDSAQPILLTLNDSQRIDPASILRRFNYHHPAYRLESVAAQKRHREISGRRRTHFCGAYWGYGFHEDGVNSALAVAEYFGIGLQACTAASTKAASSTAACAP